jgi:hypothetical protein
MTLLDGKPAAARVQVLEGNPDREGGWRDMPCSITREQFLSNRQSIAVAIGGQVCFCLCP